MSSTYPPYGGTPGKPCTRCGMLLPPNEVYCGNCGYYNAPTQNIESAQPPVANTPWGSSPQQPAYGLRQYANPAWGQPAQPAAPSPITPGSPQPPFVPPKPFSLPSHPPSPQSSPNNYASGTMPSTGPTQTGGLRQFSSSMPASPTPTGGLRQFGQFSSPMPTQPTAAPANTPYALPVQPMQSGSYYGGAAMPAYPPIQAPPVQPLPIQAPQMTSGLHAGGLTAAADSGIMKRPEEVSKPNIPVIIGIVVLLLVLIGGGVAGYIVLSHRGTSTTATTSKVAPTALPKIPALFSDTFMNNVNGWDLQGQAGKYSVAVGNGKLALEDDDNKLLWELLPGGKTFSDFKLSADVALSKGTQNNGYGFYIRGASNQNTDLATYYRFELYGDGTYAIFKGVVDGTGNSTSQKLVDYTASNAIHVQGASNNVTILAHGSSMTLTVNGQTLKTITDNSYTGGTIALFVSNLQGSPPGAQAVFSHFYIYPANA